MIRSEGVAAVQAAIMASTALWTGLPAKPVEGARELGSFTQLECFVQELAWLDLDIPPKAQKALAILPFQLRSASQKICHLLQQTSVVYALHLASLQQNRKETELAASTCSK